MIKLQVIGNLGKDCLVNKVNEKTVINFSVAHTEVWKDSNGEKKEKTTWVECAYWNEKTGIAPYLKKGQQVYAEGTPDVRTYETEGGKHGAALSLRILNVQLLGKAPEQATNGSMPQQSEQVPQQTAPVAETKKSARVTKEIPKDDLPF